MCKTKLLLLILTILLIYAVSINGAKKGKKKKSKVKFGPYLGKEYQTPCDDFSKYARFNPYSVIRNKWFVFYYWAPDNGLRTFEFIYPSINLTTQFHRILDDKVTIPVNWTARIVIMRDESNFTTLFVERDNRGRYWRYDALRRKGLQEPVDVRFKQVDNGRLLGYMECKRQTLYLLSKLNEVPKSNRIQEEAALFGYVSRKGKSYLDQGSEWVPIPDADERDYWEYSKEQTTNDGSDNLNENSIENNENSQPDKPSQEPKPSIDIQPYIDADENKLPPANFEQCDKDCNALEMTNEIKQSSYTLQGKEQFENNDEKYNHTDDVKESQIKNDVEVKPVEKNIKTDNEREVQNNSDNNDLKEQQTINMIM